MSTRLALIPVSQDLGPAVPAALFETAAAKYMLVDIATFRGLVREGAIPARSHHGRVRSIYLREDLDAYLRALPVKNPRNGGIMQKGGGRQTSEEV